MPEDWFQLSPSDRIDALEVAAARSGRPPHLLEKDIWVVWVLDVLYRSPLSNFLTFKGGTSLSKVYRLIDRFSEDLDLTYDIRQLVPELLVDGNPLPATASRQKKISTAVRRQLPQWIITTVQPVLEQALRLAELDATLTLTGREQDSLRLVYPALRMGTGYVPASVRLEFGARATGEPHHRQSIGCDMAPLIEGVVFPTAMPLVMEAERTFWEKATAAHVYCLQQRLRGDGYSRHWYDLSAIAGSDLFSRILGSQELALQVATHKSVFFAEKDVDGQRIDYQAAVSGSLQLVPAGGALDALAQDYWAMEADGLLGSAPPHFDQVMAVCQQVQEQLNRMGSETGC